MPTKQDTDVFWEKTQGMEQLHSWLVIVHLYKDITITKTSGAPPPTISHDELQLKSLVSLNPHTKLPTNLSGAQKLASLNRKGKSTIAGLQTPYKVIDCGTEIGTYYGYQ